MTDTGGDNGNRSILSLGVRALNGILLAIQALGPIGVSTVSGLGSASSARQGATALVTDATSTTFHSVVAGGGSNIVPVFNDGAGNWRIG